MPECGFILASKKTSWCLQQLIPKELSGPCTLQLLLCYTSRKAGEQIPPVTEQWFRYIFETFPCQRGPRRSRENRHWERGRHLQIQKSARPQTNLPPQNKQGNTAQKSAPVLTEINRNFNTALKGSLINAQWEADQGEMKCGSQGFFSENAFYKVWCRSSRQ